MAEPPERQTRAAAAGPPRNTAGPRAQGRRGIPRGGVDGSGTPFRPLEARSVLSAGRRGWGVLGRGGRPEQAGPGAHSPGGPPRG